MRRAARRSTLLLLAVLIALSTLLSTLLVSSNANAAPATIEDPSVGLEKVIKRWFFYRGMWGCLKGSLYQNNYSRQDIISGHWDPEWDKKGFGYFATDMDGGDGNDGTVQCDDGSVFAQGAAAYDYPKASSDDTYGALSFWCSLIDTYNNDTKSKVVIEGSSDCSKATKFDTVGTYVDSGDLTATLSKTGKRPSQQLSDNPNWQAMYYLIGKRSLENKAFCGDGGTLTSHIKENIGNAAGDKYVGVKIVDSATGKILYDNKEVTYEIQTDRKDSDNINDSFYKSGNNGDQADDYDCSDFSKFTRDQAGNYSKYVINYYNDAVGQIFIDNFKALDAAGKDAICGPKPDGYSSTSRDPTHLAYNNCLNGGELIPAVGVCKRSAELQKGLTVNDRTNIMKTCLKKSLPAKYTDFVDALATPNVKADDSASVSGDDSTETTSCAIDGIGWIICPVMNFMAKLNDQAFGFLEKLLAIKPALIGHQSTMDAWGTFRDLANVAFVIGFLVIVYSQLTSVGISNYGVKKLLPKIIIAAIMVNISYFVCALLVDVSNIVGSSVYGLLSNLVSVPGGGDSSSTWENIIGGILVGGVGILLFIVVIVSPMVLLALGVVLLILIGRQAFVILLLVVSPLAFVAYLLPNTEILFKKWRKAFSATLMVYPIVGAIFGASTLASNILMSVASSGESEDDQQLLSIVALATLAIPLFAVPAILRGSMAAAGQLGSRLQNLADKTQGKANAGAKDRFGGMAKNLGNRASTRMLNADEQNGRIRRGILKSGRFATGIGRRTKREDAYKQNQALRDAAQENFLNDGISAATNAQGQVNTANLSKTARRRVDAGAATATAKATNQLINNSGVQSSIAGNSGLYQKVAASDLATHHDQEYQKNQGEKAFFDGIKDNPAQQAHYNELIKSREDRKTAEVDVDTAAKGDAGVVAATVKRKQSEESGKIADIKIDEAYEDHEDTQELVIKRDAAEKRTETAAAKNKKAAIIQNEGVRVNAAAAAADVAAVEAREKAVIDELKTDAGAAASPQYAAAAATLKAADTATRLSTNQATRAAKQAEQAFIESTEGRSSDLTTKVAEDQLAASKAAEEAIASELRAGGRDADGNLISVDGLAPQEVEALATDLSQADVDSRVQAQRSGAAKRVTDVKYAGAVKASINEDGEAVAGGLAEVAGGIEGKAGVSQAAAVAQQTIIESFRKGVAAESTLLSSTSESDILSPTMLGSPDILDQPDEKISAMGSVIAKRQHMTSHIKLWRRMGELQNELDGQQNDINKLPENSAQRVQQQAELDAKRSKLVNLQQQVMGDKSKKPFGIGDADQGAATVGKYGTNIYEETRKRILTHLTDGSLSSMDPDDMKLLYEMGRDGKLGPEHVAKIQESFEAWEKNPNLKHLLKDKSRALLEPVIYQDYSADPESTKPVADRKVEFSGVHSMTDPASGS